MGKIRSRTDTKRLFFDFSYRGIRCREQTALLDTPPNRKRMTKVMETIEAEITLGLFDYEKHFPHSPMVGRFKRMGLTGRFAAAPNFADFSEIWFLEMKVQWRDTHCTTTRGILDKHLLPAFGKKEISQITKADIVTFRANLASFPGKHGQTLSPSRINHVMNPLRMILAEAANRYNFSSPFHGIKALKVPRTDVEPFTLDEVKLILEKVRPDFKNYFTVRFFTGMRTSEMDGLQWQFIDFARRQILVRQALVDGKLIYTKNDGSFRAIEMSEPVYLALRDQQQATGDQEFSFCAFNGSPLRQSNVTKRVWYPLLRHLNLRKRSPYQTRHTAATLWLAAGESPEWIARQMGHSTTTMLFRVYSRFVPNLTRQDGSAFERLLRANQIISNESAQSSSSTSATE